MPLQVSGCLIVRDEEDVLGASLRALWPFVDEVVVYDTGSVDGTREVAREAGARVVEGFWDDDFGAARNRALDHCAGEWVLCVDADEVIVGDPAALRGALDVTEADCLAVRIVSESGRGGDSDVSFLQGRVLRRAACRWEGLLHEYVVGVDGAPPRFQALPYVLLSHSGYTDERRRAKGKGARNLDLARRAVAAAREADDPDLDRHLVNHARSAAASGEFAEAAAAFAELDTASLTPVHGLSAGHVALVNSLALGDLEGAACWLDRMRGWGEHAPVCRGFQARIAAARGHWSEVEELLADQARLRCVDGVQLTGFTFADVLVEALARLDRPAEAFDLLLWHLREGAVQLAPGGALELSRRIPGGLARLAEAVPERVVPDWVGVVRAIDADGADDFMEALWAAGRAHPAVLAAAAGRWPDRSVDRALVWSLRLREAGQEKHCPLRRMIADSDRDLRSRLVAGALLAEVGEREVVEVLEPLLAMVPDDQAEPVLADLARYAPTFAGHLEVA